MATVLPDTKVKRLPEDVRMTLTKAIDEAAGRDKRLSPQSARTRMTQLGREITSSA